MSDEPNTPFDDTVAALIAAAGDTRLVTIQQIEDHLDRLGVDDVDVPEVTKRLFDALRARGVVLNESSEPPVFSARYAGLRVIKGGRDRAQQLLSFSLARVDGRSEAEAG
jgi:hypothetical protein